MDSFRTPFLKSVVKNRMQGIKKSGVLKLRRKKRKLSVEGKSNAYFKRQRKTISR